jgi:TRAP-type C4-dicarboxylate transport system permease small subunit
MAHEVKDTAAPQGAVGWLAALIGRGFGIFAALAILAVLVLTAINVTGRYLFTAPLRGAEEMTGFLVVAMVMLGAAEAYRRGDHIRIDLLTERLGPKGARWIDILSHLAVAAFAANLLRTGLHTVEFSRNFGAYSAGYLEIPMWIPQSALVIGGALLLAMAVLKLIESLLAFARKEHRP